MGMWGATEEGEEHHNLTQGASPSVGCISPSQDAITYLGASHLLQNVTKSRGVSNLTLGISASVWCLPSQVVSPNYGFSPFTGL